VQSTQTFDVSDSDGKKIDGYNTVDFLGSYALPVGKVSFSVENLLDKDYTTAWGQRAPGCIAQPTAHRGCIPIKAADVRLV
jgi:iron complex outermembrane receptor protein